MKPFKIIVRTVGTILLILCMIRLIFGYTIVIPISKNKQPIGEVGPKGDSVNFFKDADFSHGDWIAYINISPNDFANLNSKIIKVSCLKTSDVNLFEKMKAQWNFVSTGADVATVESIIYVFHNDRLVLKSGIALDRNREGLQNSTHGWLETMEAGALAETCSHFKPVYWPVIFL